MMKTTVLGYPRVGSRRELKKACESFWAGKISADELEQVAAKIRLENWQLQKAAGVDLIPSNDFSFYDQVLDLSLSLGVIPQRYELLKDDRRALYFAMARGYQQKGRDVIAMEMTKWFDTNYHYIVPEFVRNQNFSLYYNKALAEYREAKQAGIETKPVLIGPVSFLLLGKEKEEGFSRLDLIESLLPVYIQYLQELEQAGVEWVQIDEPFLALDIDRRTQELYKLAYDLIRSSCPNLKVLLDETQIHTHMCYSEFNDIIEYIGLMDADVITIECSRSQMELLDAFVKYKYPNEIGPGVYDIHSPRVPGVEEMVSLLKKAAEVIPAGQLWVNPDCGLKTRGWAETREALIRMVEAARLMRF